MRAVGLTLAERFWPRVDKTGDCWPWTGCRDSNGYGRIGKEKRGQTWLAHRVSWELAHGAVPADKLVCHRCDNPSCVRPDHLFLGTQIDNMRDMAAKGRAAHGRMKRNALLTDALVRRMRRLRAAGLSKYAIAKRYALPYMVASNAIERKTWKHVH